MVTTVSTGLSSIGVGSGLPLAQLLTDLRKAEELPLAALVSRKTTYDTKVSAYGIIKNAVSTLQDAAKKLVDPKTFEAVKTTSSKPEVVTARGTAGVVASTYSIDVHNLATSQVLAVDGVSSRIEPMVDSVTGEAGGTIKIQLEGDTKAREIKLTAGSSLNDVVAAINKGNSGLTASVINNGDATNPFQLILTARDTGAQAAVKNLSVEDNDTLNNLLSVTGGTPNSGMREITEAADASFTINGIDVTSGKNVVTDVVDGIEISLLDTTDGTPVKLQVSPDNSVSEAAIKGFVNAYNALQSNLNNFTQFDVEAQTQSVLTADSVTRNIQNGIRNILNTEGPEGGIFSTLSNFGISTDLQTGMLVISTAEKTGGRQSDIDRFNEAMTRPEDLAAMFSGANGFAQKAVNLLDGYLNRQPGSPTDSKGLIADAQDGLAKSIKDVEKQHANLKTRIDDRMATFQMQFTALDKMVSQMNGIGQYLTQQIAVLNGTQNQK